MSDICKGLPAWGHALVWIVILLWEFLLGKTKFKSTVSLFFNLVASILEQTRKDKK
jgi:hypothetical protein